MRSSLVLAVCLLVLSSATAAAAEDWEAKLDELSRECLFVVAGRVAEVVSNTHPDGKTLSIGTIQIRRHLKGVSTVKSIEAEFRFPSHLEMKPDDKDVVWFIREKLDSGRYLVTDWKWGQESLHMILAAINRTDKQTRIPGMPKPTAGTGPISCSLAADDGEGKALAAKKASSPRDVSLLVQFENHGTAEYSVMPCLDGSEVHWRYPHYDLEILDVEGKPVPAQGGARCGNVNPLHARDVVSLQAGEVFRTWAPWPVYSLPPGTYRARLRYTAKQDTTAEGVPLGEDDPEVRALIKTVWEGTIQSNWIKVEIGSEEQNPE